MAHQSALSEDKVVWSCSVLTFDLHSLRACVFFLSFSTFSPRICSPHAMVSVVILLDRGWKSTLTRGGRMLLNLIWLDDSILRGHTIGMQSTGSIQLLAQNSLSSFLSRPDLATMLHNLLNYSRLGEESDILTSAPLHVKQALFSPVFLVTSPNVIWVDTVFSFCWTNNTLRKSYCTAGQDGRFRTAWCERNGRGAGGRAADRKRKTHRTVDSTQSLRKDGSDGRYMSNSRSEYHVTSTIPWWGWFSYSQRQNDALTHRMLFILKPLIKSGSLPLSVERLQRIIV